MKCYENKNGAVKKTVLVTGCSSGFGRQISFFLKERGWQVYATARQEEEIKFLKGEGLKAFFLDLNSSESVRILAQDVLKDSNGSLTAIVNNAGFTQIGAVEDLSRESLRNQFETNVFGSIELTNYFIPVFRKQGYGRIVFITSSDNNAFAFPFLGAESASKNALMTFCNALRRELHNTNISVSSICPGGFHTRILEKATKYFSERVNIEKSFHRESYKKLMSYFTNSLKANKHLDLIAQEVFKILESKKPKICVVVPFETKLHYLVHKYLPERLLDCLLYLKMKFTYKII
ncbi:MAG: SDR family NAD(P)-dependent oxidoreductase [Candidatus Omnitrophica bacterium]|jgi:NAD(P)-dependent dehydrogenase (short-subunit alcohol dehydrogenase family)|nr:SDR family NAD(P)-dependent oxidoreductase [Candidatus Omnitrophota bacterium]